MNRRDLSQMVLDLSQMVLAAVIVVAGAVTARAQGFGPGGFGGPPPTEESFRRMDRNGNDTIDPEEWETVPAPIRRAYEDLADLSRPMDYDDFAEVSQRMREQMMSRFGGGRGMDFGRGSGRNDRSRDGGDEGPRGGDRDGGDRDGRSRRGRGGFGSGGFGPEGFDDSASSNADSGGKKGAKSERVTKPRTPINVKLPDQYRSLDKDRDGQIGLYEWSRSDYAGFRKLDWNGDGFLTPQELLKGPGARTDLAAVATNASSPKSGGGGSTGPGAGTGPAPSSSGSGSSGRAETAFRLLDKNENGTISEDEWKKSLSTGPTFEKAGIKVSFPLSRNEFLRLFPQAYPSAGK